MDVTDLYNISEALITHGYRSSKVYYETEGPDGPVLVDANFYVFEGDVVIHRKYERE